LEIDRGPRSEAYSSALHEYERHDQQFDRLQAVVRRPTNNLNIAPWIFWLMALALAILEAPVNKFLFDYAIQGSNLTSYLVSSRLRSPSCFCCWRICAANAFARYGPNIAVAWCGTISSSRSLPYVSSPSWCRS
jgi:hypothetical protein